ncbi:hypothetical protein C8J57DRAFT_418508 [Mycena rebaudengoi]|nr:hypothetical protein C8J57DRAFT_418508 [Mycena rebaudengoi]
MLTPLLPRAKRIRLWAWVAAKPAAAACTRSGRTTKRTRTAQSPTATTEVTSTDPYSRGLWGRRHAAHLSQSPLASSAASCSSCATRTRSGAWRTRSARSRGCGGSSQYKVAHAATHRPCSPCLRLVRRPTPTAAPAPARAKPERRAAHAHGGEGALRCARRPSFLYMGAHRTRCRRRPPEAGSRCFRRIRVSASCNAASTTTSAASTSGGRAGRHVGDAGEAA